MKIEIDKLSTKYKVRKLNESDAEAVLRLEYTNPLYFEHCPPAPNMQKILDDMKALPPKKSFEDKYYIGFFEKNELIAVMDLILQYPDEHTVFAGFFMVLSTKQGAGIGTEITDECISELKRIGFSSVRLGYMKGNPQSKAFWYKNKFKPTGIEVNTEQGTIIVMERRI